MKIRWKSQVGPSQPEELGSVGPTEQNRLVLGTCQFAVDEMGGDGGSIPSRYDLVELQKTKKPEEFDHSEQQLVKWCALHD